MLDKENEASFSRLLGSSTHDSLVDMSLESPLQELVPLNLKHLVMRRQNCTQHTQDTSSQQSLTNGLQKLQVTGLTSTLTEQKSKEPLNPGKKLGAVLRDAVFPHSLKR